MDRAHRLEFGPAAGADALFISRLEGEGVGRCFAGVTPNEGGEEGGESKREGRCQMREKKKAEGHTRMREVCGVQRRMRGDKHHSCLSCRNLRQQLFLGK